MLCSALIAAAPIRADDNPAGDVYAKRLLVADADGTNIRPVMRLQDFLDGGSPDWSADGKRAAMDSWRPALGEKGPDAQLIVFDIDGTNVRTLGDGAMPSFSPQAKRIAYSRYSPNRGVWVIDVETPDSEPVLLDDRGWGTDWSPDGTRIAFTKYTSGGANFCIYSLVEGTREFIFEDGQTPYRQISWNFSWSPDSKYLAFHGVRSDGVTELAVVDARGARYGLNHCHEGPIDFHVSWTPDGKVLFAEETNKKLQLYTVDPADPDEPPVRLPLAPEHSINEGVFSPDGRQVMFIMRRPPPEFSKR